MTVDSTRIVIKVSKDTYELLLAHKKERGYDNLGETADRLIVTAIGRLDALARYSEAQAAAKRAAKRRKAKKKKA